MSRNLMLDLEAGERRRDAGIAAAGGSGNWIERAVRLVVHFMCGQEVLAEQFRALCMRHGVEPETANGWGSLTYTLSKRGLIVDTGRLEKSQDPRSHARRQPVWRVVG
jgi:hypothetical protein